MGFNPDIQKPEYIYIQTSERTKEVGETTKSKVQKFKTRDPKGAKNMKSVEKARDESRAEDESVTYEGRGLARERGKQ